MKRQMNGPKLPQANPKHMVWSGLQLTTGQGVCPLSLWLVSLDWAYSRIINPSYNVKCRQRRKTRPDPAPAKARKDIASRYYQLKTGRALTGMYLKWIGSREDDTCRWCHRPGSTQTREHLFKTCTAWRRQQKVLWKEVRLQTRRGRDRFRIADLFADERCTEAILTFLETTDVGRQAREEDWENGSESSLEEDGDVVDMGDEEELMEVEVEGAGGGGVYDSLLVGQQGHRESRTARLADGYGLVLLLAFAVVCKGS